MSMVDKSESVQAPLTGTIIRVDVVQGDVVSVGTPLCLIESMKLEHPITASLSGTVTHVHVAPGLTVSEGEILIAIEPGEALASTHGAVATDQSDDAALTEVEERRHKTTDAARPEATERIRSLGRLTAREKIDALIDEGPFHEYGTFTVAAQRARRTMDELIERTPADGLVTGIASVNGDLFSPDTTLVAILAYDTTVLAGTQGVMNHKKTDRLLDVARARQLPVVLFADGGGGRPGDTETITKTGLDVPTFAAFARLSGTVPLIGVVSGYCFAGNAILAGMCDVIVATRHAHIGAGGPAMIEGGGLGVVSPDAIGPTEIQHPNGVIDVLVEDDESAVKTVKAYLSYFQGSITTWEAPEQERLRSIVPSNRRRTYDVRSIISTLADTGSVLELRSAFARSLITAFARIEGVPVGVMANDPSFGGGAIDADAGDKGARFTQLCDAFGIPVLSLVDTPGIMVGPDSERDATVRHASRMFVAGANARIPIMAVITRRGYGLGAMAMVGGGFKESAFTVAWPTATLGPMGLEGAVRLGYRRELEAIDDPAERGIEYDRLVAGAYDDGKALNAATWFDVDEVIDPADTRSWVAAVLCSLDRTKTHERRPYVDTW